MDQAVITAAGIIGISAVVATFIYTIGKLRIEQQRTIRRLLDQGGSAQDIVAAFGGGAVQADRRRGLLLIALGLSWAIATFFIGGVAWAFGAVPVGLGLVFLLLGKLDASRR